MKHYKEEKTLVIIKPDGVQRSLVGDVVSRFERVGLKLTALKLIVPGKDEVKRHYTLDSGWKEAVGKKSIESYEKKGKTPPSRDALEVGERVLERLVSYMTSGPVVLMVWQGSHSVALVRKLVGGTEPHSSDVGTIRGDYVLDSYEMADTDERAIRNLIHASSSFEEAENEIAHWFSENEVINYNIVQESIVYDTDLKGIFKD
ncbi:MAG: nucleoside-diphosphate kinase [Candidatus Paceibacterota bacterium]